MIDNFFYSKWAINLNDNCRKACRKAEARPLDITFLHKFWYQITINCMKGLFLQKNLTIKMIKISYSPQISANCRKNCLPWKKKRTLIFSNSPNLIFFKNLSFTKVNSQKHICLRINHGLSLIKMHWSYFKYNDLLHTWNAYKFPGKQHQVDDFWVTDEISASKILFLKY